MLPSTSAGARSVVGVADDLLRALRGESASLPGVRSTVLIVIDGLGAIPLRAHAGHARRLTADMNRKDIAYSVFPTTTASGLTSVLTGVHPGEHGLVGYQVLDAVSDRVFNQLTDWESAGIDPFSWQPVPTIFERAAEDGRAAFAVGVAAYAASGFTRATLRGAAFVAARTPAERVEAAYELAAANAGALVYCYLPEVDKAGHRYGIASSEWVSALEDIDAAMNTPVPPGVGVLVTADHGMLDVPSHRHVVLDEGDPRWGGVRHVAGEPRMLHLHLDPGRAPSDLQDIWRAHDAGLVDVLTRGEAIDAGLFGGVVTDAATVRIGDLLVIARGNVAVYDGRGDLRARGMVGQHGALTPEERQVPYLRFGAFAR